MPPITVDSVIVAIMQKGLDFNLGYVAVIDNEEPKPWTAWVANPNDIHQGADAAETLEEALLSALNPKV